MSNKQAHFADEEYNHVAQASKCGQSNVSTATEDKMVRTIIKDVSDTSIDKSGPKISQFNYIDIKSVDRDKKAITGASVISSDAAPSRAKQHLKKGDIIVSMTRPNLNAVAMVTAEFDCAIASTGFHIIRPKNIESKFIYYLVQSRDFIDAMCEKTQGALYPAVRPRDIESYEFWLPTSKGQQEIVTKIEELFSELDSGIASLKTARDQLKIYRQALLKHAFEGKLTEQWRKDNADQLETPEQLLARIQTERETRYQQQLNDWKQAVKDWEVKGKEGKKPSKPKSFEKNGEFDNNSALNLEIPEDWQLMLVGHVFSVFVGATPSRKNPSFWGGDIRWVSSGEVAFCNIHQTKEKISHEGYENTSTEIHPEGTVLLAMIGEGKTRGQAAILRVPAAHNQNTAAIRVSEIGLPAEYFYYFLQYQYEQTRKSGSGNNQKALNKSRVSSIIFPLCSIAEQQEIVNLLEEKLSIIEQNEKEIETALAKAELLRQSILKKAFSGQLVSQVQND